MKDLGPDRCEAILPKQKDTKRFQKFVLEDPDEESAITSMYIRNGMLRELEEGETIKVTVEVVDE